MFHFILSFGIYLILRSNTHVASCDDAYSNTSLTRKETSIENISNVCNIRPHQFYRITSGILTFFIPITILGNGLVVIVMYMSPIYATQPSYIIITSLAVADVFVGLFSMPIKAKIQWHQNYFCLPQFVCWIHMLEEVIFSVASASHLFAIAAERYVGVKYPYRYKTIVSRHRVTMVVGFIWLTSFISSMLSAIRWKSPFSLSIESANNICLNNNREYFTILYVLCFMVPFFFMSFVYHFVYKTSVRHINQMTTLDVFNSPMSRERNRRVQYYRMVRTITFVFFVYVICWIPTVLFTFMVFYLKQEFWQVHVRSEWFHILYFILVQFLPHLNSTLNPFIYVISNAEFRYATNQLLIRKSKRQSFKLSKAKNMGNQTANVLPMVQCNIAHSLDENTSMVENVSASGC